MECVLSIVDEGTRLRAVVATTNGTVVGLADVDGTANPRFIEPRGLRRRLEQAVTQASRSLDDALCLSVCAAVRADPDEVRGILAELVPIDRERVLIAPIEKLALAGSLGGVDLRQSIVIRADIGSRGWGVSESGAEAILGGYGDELGGEGGARWIGCRGVNGALKAFEKRSRNTRLKDRLLSHFEVSSHRQLLVPEHLPPMLDRFALAGFARHVFEAAREDDELSLEILAEGGRELASVGLALVNELDLIDEPFNVLPSGLVFQGRGRLLEEFVKVLKTKTRKAMLVQEGLGAAAGGLLLAVEYLGLKVRPEAVDLLRSSFAAREEQAG